MRTALLIAETAFYVVVAVSLADALIQLWRRRRAAHTMVAA